ncbi:hypothetical protein TeGR_g3109 [Tetraparma gracilis]|uniref:WASH1 WAHD domain-containing protein n=1 Tax=Tetraparma gracilis TaxID=2962635 RepID=A0ABQ6N3R1_9STRA|nr:hypothetical protein TeGR_g3109 [Tetraparma gracilis]
MAIFDLPPPHTDLQQTENLLDSLHSLSTLDSAVSSVFDRLLSRISAESSRVASLDSRGGLAREKIGRIGSNRSRATTVFSSSKHPATKPPAPHARLFQSTSDPLAGAAQPAQPDPEIEYVTADPATSAVGSAAESGELQGLYARLNPHRTDMVRVEIKMEEEGLGPLPGREKLRSVGGTLLFNSRSNPYKKYSRLDNLVGSSSRERAASTEEKKDLMHAPTTLVDGDLLPDVAALDLMFKPEMGEMNNLNLPTNLDLANLADVNFTSAEGAGMRGIAPSQYQQANQLMLPAIEGFAAPPSQTEGIAAIRSSDKKGLKKSAEAPVAKKPVKAGTMSLLDQIQGTGKGGLKKAAERVIASKKKETEVKKPLTMFEQLQESMNRRQAAISGKKDRQEQKRETIAVMGGAEDFRKSVRSSLTSIGPGAARGEAGFEEAGSGSDSDSDGGGRGRAFTDDSFGASPPKVEAPIGAKAKAKAPAPAPAPARPPAASVDSEGSERRGSMWDNKSLNRMVSLTQEKSKDGDDDSDEGDWDE